MNGQSPYLLPALVLCSAAGAVSRYLVDLAVSALARAATRGAPAPTDLEPPEAVDKAPAHPEPATRAPAHPEPATRAPANRAPAHPEPATRAPAVPVPARPAPAEAARANPAPWGIAVVNATGALGLGLLTGLADRAGVGSATVTLVGVGFLGSYTTFSTFAVDTLRLYRFGRRGAAVANVAGTLVLGLGLVSAGYAVAS